MDVVYITGPARMIGFMTYEVRAGVATLQMMKERCRDRLGTFLWLPYCCVGWGSLSVCLHQAAQLGTFSIQEKTKSLPKDVGYFCGCPAGLAWSLHNSPKANVSCLMLVLLRVKNSPTSIYEADFSINLMFSIIEFFSI